MFGNLYLLSQSKNSRLSNLTPVAKRDIIKTWKNCDSLKQVIMMSHDKWGGRRDKSAWRKNAHYSKSTFIQN